MAKSTVKPPNGPSKTGKPSGDGRGNNPSKTGGSSDGGKKSSKK